MSTTTIVSSETVSGFDEELERVRRLADADIADRVLWAEEFGGALVETLTRALDRAEINLSYQTGALEESDSSDEQVARVLECATHWRRLRSMKSTATIIGGHVAQMRDCMKRNDASGVVTISLTMTRMIGDLVEHAETIGSKMGYAMCLKERHA